MSDQLEDFENEEKEEQISSAEYIKILEAKIKTLEKEVVKLKGDLKKKYSIFFPKSKRGLQADYPEFKKIREFQSINPLDLLFVWYYSCEGSPFAGIEKQRDRVLKSMDEAYKNPSAEQKEKYISGNFPEKVKIAISKMSAFRVGPRVSAMMMMENTLNNWKAITDIDASDDSYFTGKDGIDWTKKKAFIEAGATISKNIGQVLSQVEGSYSVSVKKDEEELGSFENLIEDYHDSKN